MKNNTNNRSLGERFYKINKQDMTYRKQIDKANQKSQKYKDAYFEAFKYLKANSRSITSFQKNILVLDDLKYRLLNHSDFYNCHENQSFNKSVRERLYCDIYNFLSAEEQKFNLTTNHNNAIQSNNFLPTANYSITDNIPTNVIDFLYEISLGDFGIIKSLAQLYYKIIFKPNIPLYPTVILADKSIHNDLFEFFSKLTNTRLVKTELSLMANINELQLIASANWNNTVLLAVSIESDISEAESKIKTIKKVLRGQNLSIKHPYFPGKLFINNRIPFVYITESHEKYLKMKNIYNAQLIKIPSKKITPSKLGMISEVWFKNDFTKLGFKTYNNPKSKLITPKITNDEILESFSNNICIFGQNLDCSTAELYTAYTEYYKKNYGNTPLSFRKFRTQFAIINNLDTYRPHHNNKSNPRCFKGVSIDYDKYAETIKKNESISLQYTKKILANSLLEMIRK